MYFIGCGKRLKTLRTPFLARFTVRLFWHAFRCVVPRPTEEGYIFQAIEYMHLVAGLQGAKFPARVVRGQVPDPLKAVLSGIFCFSTICYTLTQESHQAMVLVKFG